MRVLRMGICIALANNLSIQGSPNQRTPSCFNLSKEIVTAPLAGMRLLITSCGDPPEDLAEDSTDMMKEIDDVPLFPVPILEGKRVL